MTIVISVLYEEESEKQEAIDLDIKIHDFLQKEGLSCICFNYKQTKTFSRIVKRQSP